MSFRQSAALQQQEARADGRLTVGAHHLRLRLEAIHAAFDAIAIASRQRESESQNCHEAHLRDLRFISK
ncbi:hypothetical protein [Bradyrhizobium erythrophlei]|uniref:hypothetical protein n=1 Tax=Bradyrhizobium erythrophlei TaxID=1437360 RepID=UPI0012EC06F6|nr:hypothetical protein [Bradyrhizobium erythrophlei]